MSTAYRDIARAAPQIASVIGGRQVESDNHADSTNPAELEDVVATVRLADAATLQDACRIAHEAQARWSVVPAPGKAGGPGRGPPS